MEEELQRAYEEGGVSEDGDFVEEAAATIDRQSGNSFGTGSFTTGTFNARLAGSDGMEILRYVQSQNFGKYGESIKLIEHINVSGKVCARYDLVFVPSGIHDETR